MAAEQVIDGCSAAAIGHVDDVDAGLLAQELAGEMVRRAGAGGAVVELAGIGLGIGDHVGDRTCGKFGVNRETMMFAPA